MSHSVSETAARAVKNSQRGAAVEKTPEEMFKEIRSNLAAKLYVTPTHVGFLLAHYDQECADSDAQALYDENEISRLREDNKQLRAENEQFRAENEQFRTVYDQENSSRGTVSVEIAEGVVESESETSTAGE